MKSSRSYCQAVTWLDCETVSQSSHVTTWHSHSYCPTHFWYILCFIFLCLAGCSVADTVRLLFIIGYRNGQLLALQPCANLTPRLHVLCCNYAYAFVCVRIRHSESLAEIIFYGRSKVENDRTKLCSDNLSTHFLYLISSSGLSACASS